MTLFWSYVTDGVLIFIILSPLIILIAFLICLIWINRKLKYFNNAFDEYLKYKFSRGNWDNNWNC